MAQGCHLIYSNADREHFPLDEVPDSLTVDEVAVQFKVAFDLPWHNVSDQGIVREGPTGIEIDPGKAAVQGVRAGRVEVFTERYEKLDEKSKVFMAGLLTARGDQQAEILEGIGNPHLKDEMARELPAALEIILRQDPGCSGLFTPARAGASTWMSTLKNSNGDAAAGIAYEVQTSAKIIEGILSGLKVGPRDKLDFGRKFQASYGSQGNLITSDHEHAGFFFQPDRKTVEADFLIKRPISLTGGGEEIGVDFKHSSGTVRIEKEVLLGVKTAIATGEADEWHYVSNADFSNSVELQVKELNEELRKSGNGLIHLHPGVKW